MNEANSVACEIMQLDLAIFSVSISYTENQTKRGDVKPVYFDSNPICTYTIKQTWF